MKLSNFLLKYIYSQGVTKVFGIPGRENEKILFNEVPGLEYVTPRIEFSAGIMGVVSGILKREPQVVFATMGPGATNLTTAIATAQLNKSPTIFITAQTESYDRFYGQTHQCINQAEILKPLCKISQEIEQPEDILKLLPMCFSEALKEPLAPCHISVPVDFYEAEIEVDESIFKHKFSYDNQNQKGVELEKLNEASALINLSQKPIIIIGHEVIRSGAAGAVLDFCEKIQAPVIHSANAKGSLSSKHPLNIGSVSPYMEQILKDENYLGRIFNDVDLIINIGYQYSDDILPGMWQRGIKKKLIGISGVKCELPESMYYKSVECIGDIKRGLEILTESAEKREDGCLDNRESSADNKDIITGGDSDGIIISDIINQINKYKGDSGVVTDIGFYRHHLILGIITDKIDRFYTDAGISSFGNGLPAAMAMAIGIGNRVILIAGDGGFHSGSGDLETLARLNLPITIIILNNSKYELINKYQKKSNVELNPKILEFNTVNFSLLANANGINGVHVDNIESFAEAFKLSISDDKPMLIDVQFDYDDSEGLRESF